MLRLPARRFALFAVIATVGCGRQHDLGVGGSSPTSTNTGGAGGATSSSTSTTGGAGGATSSSTSSGTGGVDAGPSGPTELTIVNGINDYSAIRLCFLPGDTPWPATGLAFATSKVVAPLAPTIPTGGDVTPWVIAGDLAQTSGKTCTEILALAASDAGAPAVIAQPLAVIPQSVWASNKSLLMVPNGCLGGPGHDDANAKLACGSSYGPTTPTAGVTLVAMSRVQDPGHVSLQVASASPALPEMDVRVLPNLMDAQPIPIVSTITQGAIGPTPPFNQLTVNGFGPLDGAQIQTFSQGTPTPTSSVTFADIFANGGVAESAFVNGASVVLVAVGAAPGLATAKFWHALTYAPVVADPG